ncbi:MAG TPA: hypothetical protein VN626_07115 [Clostridia bacterium]|nr:hypothetical protein [Clostridia bacterium]
MMDNTKAWEAFLSTGFVCDYLRYAAESRQTEPMLDSTVRQNKNEGETKTPCSVSRTE